MRPNRRIFYFPIAFFIIALLQGCGRNSDIAGSAAGGACDADSALVAVRQRLAEYEHEAHYLTIAGELTLSFWLIDPELNVEYDEQGMSANRYTAYRTGLTRSWDLIREVPCFREIFSQTNPMIVDARSYAWYIDVIPVGYFPEDGAVEEEVLVRMLDRIGGASWNSRGSPPADFGSPAEGTCAWSEARTRLQAVFGEAERNTAAYLIIDDNATLRPFRGEQREDVFIQAQWDVADPADATEPRIRPVLERMADALDCLWLPFDRLEVMIVDAQGRLLTYAIVEGDAIRSAIRPLPAEAMAFIPVPSYAEETADP